MKIIFLSSYDGTRFVKRSPDPDNIGEAPQSLEEYKDAIIKVLKNPHNYTKCKDVIEQLYTQEASSRRFEEIINKVLTKYSYIK